MKIAALVHFATPFRNAGSETVLHLALKALVDAGHEVRCYVTDCPGAREQTYDGVHLIPTRNVTLGIAQLRRWQPEVVVSHHQNALITHRYAPKFGAKTVFLTHNDMNVNDLPLTRWKPDLVVHNSEWVRESLQRYGPQAQEMVMHPPLDCARHTVTPTGRAVTLINVNEHKGARFLYGLAARMPDVEFIAVLGGHGVQIHPPKSVKNVTVVKHNPDLRPVWEQTRLLIMPSIYESYGLTGVEAGCSGIPTLANPTPGLRESLGAAGLFVSWPADHLPATGPRYWESKEWQTEWSTPSVGHLNEWEAGIRLLLDDPVYWQKCRTQSAQNSARLCQETAEGLGRFVTAVEGLRHADTVSVA